MIIHQLLGIVAVLLSQIIIAVVVETPQDRTQIGYWSLYWITFYEGYNIQSLFTAKSRSYI